MRLGVVGLVLVGVGCGPPTGSDEGDGIGEVGGGSMLEEPPPLGSSCTEASAAETFEVVNVGASNLYLQLTGAPGSSPVSLTHEGAAVRFADCGICSCDDCPSCAVCSVAPAVVLALGPMESYALTWNGNDYPVVDAEEPHNRCDSSCTYRCPLGPGAMSASVSHSDWFSTFFSPSVVQQGIVDTGTAQFQHPAGTTRIELVAPAASVEPRLMGTSPAGAIETTYVVASINPSDPDGGLEIAALYGEHATYRTAEYLGLFAPAEVGTHPLMEGGWFRRAVHGVHGDVTSDDSIEGSVTIDVLTEDAVEGSFEFQTVLGDAYSGTFTAPLRG